MADGIYRRYIMANNWEKVRVDNSDMPLYVNLPASERTVPGIVVVHGRSGLEDFIKDTTKMFAQLGYAAVAPSLYHRDGPDCKDDNEVRKARLRDPSIIRDIEGAIGFLKNHKQVDGSRLGIVGFCMGGRLVYLMSAASKDLKAGVMFYGSSTMVPYGEARTDALRPHARNQLSDPRPLRRRRSKSITRRHAQTRRRADQVRQAARVSHLRRRGARLRQLRIEKLPAPCRGAFVAQGDGVFCAAFGAIRAGPD